MEGETAERNADQTSQSSIEIKVKPIAYNYIFLRVYNTFCCV